MKRSIITFILINWLAVSLAEGGFKVPRSAYRMSQIADAQVEARERQKAIAIIYSDENVGCPIQSRASEEDIEAFDNGSIIVYAHWGNDWESLPVKAREAINGLRIRAMPVAIVMDSELQEVMAAVPCRSDEERRDAMKQGKKAVSEYRKQKTINRK